MSLQHILELANSSFGTLYLMAALLLVALTVVIERSLYLLRMQQGGEELIALLASGAAVHAESFQACLRKRPRIPQAIVVQASLIEPPESSRDTCSGHLEEAVMREVPTLDRSLWVLDTVITLAPLLGLFGTIIGMFSAFSVLGDVQNGVGQVTGGIAEALVATASGLFIAMIGLVCFNWLNAKVRLIVHQMETIKVMLLNRRFGNVAMTATRPELKVV